MWRVLYQLSANATHQSLKPSEPQIVHELLCALTDDYKYIEIENKSQQYKLKSGFSQVRKLQSQKSVRFSSDRPQLFDVPAYSRLYGCLPSAIVATNNGWKSVSARANHWTGKSTEVMQARQQAISAKRDFGHKKVQACNDTNR